MRTIQKIVFAASFGCLLLVCTQAKAQGGIPADTLKNMMIKDWERAKSYTQEYLKAMPASKYTFKANDSIRNFAQQMLHLAQGTWFLVSSGTGEKPMSLGNLEQRSSAQTADSVMYYVNQSYDFAIRSIRSLTPATMMQTATVNMGRPLNEARMTWINKAFEHQTHHRGQTTIYLRLAGVKPPNERLF